MNDSGSRSMLIHGSFVFAGLVALGRQGVALTGEGYQNQIQFVFSGLADLKPAMIEEATKNASQGQFSIEYRDSTTPHIRKVRVVSTVEYHLAD
ncbi:MAG: hypothetical protein ACT4UQ_08740 [Gammaproteobacteria bacterium]